MSKCKTGKRRFRDELDAKIVLAKVSWKDREEKRTYRCGMCGGWHLTSQEKRVREVTLA